MRIEKLILENLIHDSQYASLVGVFLKKEYFRAHPEKVIFSEIQKYIRDYNKPPGVSALAKIVTDRNDLNETLFQSCLGIPWGAPATISAMKAFIDLIPKGSHWSGFAISKMEMPFVAHTVSLGGNVRVGLEDNLYLEKGVFATNAQLVEKAIEIITGMGSSILTPEETRKKLKLTKHK